MSLESKGSRAVCAVFLLTVCIFFLSAAVLAADNIKNSNAPGSIFRLLAAVIAAEALLIFLVLKIRRDRLFFALLATVSLGVRVLWILLVNTDVDSDYWVLYDSALKAAAGDFSFTGSDYYLSWAYQMGFTLYEALVVSVFGEGTLVLKLINCLVSAGTVLLVYRTARVLFGEMAGRIAGILYALYVPAVIINSILTNQPLAAFLFWSGLYLIVANGDHKIGGYIGAGVLFALGEIIRPVSAVALAAFALSQLISYLSEKRKKIIVGTLTTAAVYAALFASVSGLCALTGISPNGFRNNNMLWKFVLGFNDETTGRYSQSDAEYVDQFELGSERQAAEKALIRERTHNLIKLLSLMYKKYKIMWGTEDDTVFWSVNMNKPELVDRLVPTEQLMYTGAFVFASVAAFSLLRSRKKTSSRACMFLLLLLIYAGVHLLIEIQTRYREFAMPAVFLFSGYGLSLCIESVGAQCRKLYGNGSSALF